MSPTDRPPDGVVDAAGAALCVITGRLMTVVDVEPESFSWTATAATPAPAPAEASSAATAIAVLMLLKAFRGGGTGGIGTRAGTFGTWIVPDLRKPNPNST